MKHLIPHYANLAGSPSLVEAAHDSLRAYNMAGELQVCVQLDGAGNPKDMSEELGLPRKHSLDPLPKDGRLYKHVEGKLVKDDKFDERAKLRKEFEHSDGWLKSCSELVAEGYKFDEKQVVREAPKK